MFLKRLTNFKITNPSLAFKTMNLNITYYYMCQFKIFNYNFFKKKEKEPAHKNL